MTIDPALLEPGERLLWSGRPNALRYAQARSGIRIMLGLAALVCSEFLMTAARDGKPVAWIGAAVLVIAIGLLLSPLLLVWRARVTDYALTDRRALIVVHRPFGLRVVVPLSRIQTVELRPRSGGAGDVLIGEAVGAEVQRSVGFMAIPDAQKVERLLRSLVPPSAATA